MLTAVLTDLLPDFEIALNKLGDDVSAIKQNASWLYGDVEKRLYGERVLEAIRDISKAATDSLARLEALKEVYRSLSCGKRAADMFKEFTHPKPPRS